LTDTLKKHSKDEESRLIRDVEIEFLRLVGMNFEFCEKKKKICSFYIRIYVLLYKKLGNFFNFFRFSY